MSKKRLKFENTVKPLTGFRVLNRYRLLNKIDDDTPIDHDIVVEERLISQDGDYYYNRKIILNEEINRQYSYIVKKSNNYLLASTYIKFTK